MEINRVDSYLLPNNDRGYVDQTSRGYDAQSNQAVHYVSAFVAPTPKRMEQREDYSASDYNVKPILSSSHPNDVFSSLPNYSGKNEGRGVSLLHINSLDSDVEIEEFE